MTPLKHRIGSVRISIIKINLRKVVLLSYAPVTVNNTPFQDSKSNTISSYLSGTLYEYQRSSPTLPYLLEQFKVPEFLIKYKPHNSHTKSYTLSYPLRILDPSLNTIINLESLIATMDNNAYIKVPTSFLN